MNTVKLLLEELGRVAQRDTSPEVDVRMRVLRTLNDYDRSRYNLSMSPAFAAIVFSIASLMVLLVYPALVEVLDPWVYFLSY